MIYVVQKGDTLYKIGKQFGVLVADIQSWNSLPTATLQIGQHLHVSDPFEEISARLDKIEGALFHPLAMAGAGDQVTQPPTGVFATLTFANTDGSNATPSESYVTFGMAFKKGDVPSTNTPVLTRHDNAASIPAQFDLRSTWADGSLRWCEISCVAPSIAGGGTLDVDISSHSGSYNNTQVRNITDVTGTTDLKVAVTNWTDFNGSTIASGSQTLSLNSAANVSLIKSGPICDQWRIWDVFPGQTAGGEQLAGWFYVTAWTKQSNSTLAAISHITKVHNGFVNLTGPTKYIYNASYKDGSTTIRDCSPTASFSAAGSNNITVTGHGRATGDPVQVSGGSLPTGLSTSTIYYLISVDADTLAFATSGPNAQSGTKVTIGATGSGTLNFNIFHHHHSHWWTCDADALSDWTSSEATIAVKHDISYLHSTGVLPPYDTSLTLTPSSPSTSLNYHAMCAGGPAGTVGYRLGIDGPGETNAAMIGWLPMWDVFSFLTQNLAYKTNSRVCAHALGAWYGHWINEATGRIPTMIGTSTYGATGNYTNLGTNMRDVWWFSGGNKSASGVVSPSGDEGAFVSTTRDWSHNPEGIYYTLVTEGGAHLLDAQLIYANHFFFMWNKGVTTYPSTLGSSIKISSGSNTYYGCYLISIGSNQRSSAWVGRTLNNAAAICPDNWDEKPYLKDLIRINALMASDFIADTGNRGANFTNGHWDFNKSTEMESPWMHNWLTAVIGHQYKLHELSTLLTFVNHMKKKPIGFCDGTFGCAFGGALEHIVCRNSATSEDWADWPNVALTFGGPSGYTANASTDVVTAACVVDTGASYILNFPVSTSVTWTPGSDFKVKFLTTNNNFSAQTNWGGITANTWYYPVSISGNTFKLSLTQGGSPIDITSASGTLTGVSWFPTTCPSSGTWPPDSSVISYLSIQCATLNYLKACGISGVDTALAAAEAAIAIPYTTALYNATPKYKMQASF